MSAEISQIRSFLTTRLNETQTGWRPYKKPFNDDQVGENQFEKSFHIEYLPSTLSVINQTTTQDDIAVRVDLYFKAKRESTDEIDKAVDLANKYRMNCSHPRHLRSVEFIKRVVATDMTPTPMNTNDERFKISLTFSIRTVFGIGTNFGCN